MRATRVYVYYTDEADANQHRVAGVQVDFEDEQGGSSRGVSFSPSKKLAAMTFGELVIEAVNHLSHTDRVVAHELLER